MSSQPPPSPDPFAGLRDIEDKLQTVERTGRALGRWTPAAQAAADRIRAILTERHRAILERSDG